MTLHAQPTQRIFVHVISPQKHRFLSRCIVIHQREAHMHSHAHHGWIHISSKMKKAIVQAYDSGLQALDDYDDDATANNSKNTSIASNRDLL